MPRLFQDSTNGSALPNVPQQDVSKLCSSFNSAGREHALMQSCAIAVSQRGAQPSASSQAGCTAPAGCHADQSTTSASGLAQRNLEPTSTAWYGPSPAPLIHHLLCSGFHCSARDTLQPQGKRLRGTLWHPPAARLAAGRGKQQAVTAAEIFNRGFGEIHFNNRRF